MESTKLIDIFGITVGFNTLISMISTLVIVFILCIFFTRNLKVENPGRSQTIFEYLISFIRGIVEESFGNQIEPIYIVLSLTLFLFIFVANIIGLPFLVEAHELSYWKSPTADPVVCIALALTMNFISHILAVKKFGFGGYIKQNYCTPNVAVFPVKLADEIISIATLSLRLFGNVFAGEILLGLIAQLGNSLGLATWLAGIPLQIVWQGFSLFIGALQAYIFVTLSMVYLSHKVVTNH
ncbi:F0F1 ATP synthase subunit A [Aerococcaceae bacterium WGS1372]